MRRSGAPTPVVTLPVTPRRGKDRATSNECPPDAHLQREMASAAAGASTPDAAAVTADVTDDEEAVNADRGKRRAQPAFP
jgi:hypothetical protein